MRFPELYADRIWSRIGAERDAEIIVDTVGFAAAEGGFCTTLRDLARFGLMHLQRGEIGGRRVVPATWIERLHTRDGELIAAFDDDSFPDRPDAFYHDAWWVWDGAAGIYSGYGINGQQLLVHHPSRTVIARFSTWPSAGTIACPTSSTPRTSRCSSTSRVLDLRADEHDGQHHEQHPAAGEGRYEPERQR